MPLTSSNSSIKRWPSSEVVVGALNAWSEAVSEHRPDLVAPGCFGSSAWRDAGFGSDLDLIAIIEADDRPFAERGREWPTERLPVPTDLLVYSVAEWERLQVEGGRFDRTVDAETRWLVQRELSPRP